MTDRQKLKEMGLDYHKIAEFFGLTPGSFQNSSARKRYESAILKCALYLKGEEPVTDFVKKPQWSIEKRKNLSSKMKGNQLAKKEGGQNKNGV